MHPASWPWWSLPRCSLGALATRSSTTGLTGRWKPPQPVGSRGSSSCDSFREVVVTETGSEVRLTALVRKRHLIATAYTADLVFREVSVTLHAPLVPRQLTGCMLGDADYFTLEDGLPRDSCRDLAAAYRRPEPPPHTSHPGLGRVTLVVACGHFRDQRGRRRPS